MVTRAGTDTMPTRRDEDEIAEDAAPTTARGANRVPRFGTRAHATMTPPAPERPRTPDDLRDVLRAPDSFGVKLFEINVLQAILTACPDVKDAGDLLILRETLLEEFGPAYMCLINLSLVDWLSLSADDKTLNAPVALRVALIPIGLTRIRRPLSNASSTGVIVACRRTPVSMPLCLSATT